jgi:hypothetical protein
MADETNHSSTTSSDVTTTTTVTAPSTGGKVTFTPEQQEQVDRIVAERVARVKQPVAAAKTADQDTPSEALSLKSLKAELEETKLRAAFDKRAAKLSLPDEDHDDLFENWKNKQPDAREAWLEQKAKRFMTTTKTDPAATTTASAVTEPKPASAPNAPGRVDPLTAGGQVNIFNLTDSEINQLGPQGLRKHFETLLEAGNRANGAPQRPTPGKPR